MLNFSLIVFFCFEIDYYILLFQLLVGLEINLTISSLFLKLSLMTQVTACEHAFCKACLIDYSSSLGRVCCPSCSKLLTVELTTNQDSGDPTCKTTIKGFKASSIINRIQIDNFQTSTKIEALV